MVRRNEESPSSTIQAALNNLKVEELRSIAQVFRQSLPTRKHELILLIEAELEAGKLQQIWSSRGERDRAAVSEAVYSTNGCHYANRFVAKYGVEPDWVSAARHGAHVRSTILQALFCGSGRLPEEMRDRLRAFVPEPAPAAI